MIAIQNLHKSFGRQQVLDGISMAFNRPGITAILGPNGSGKTTLIKSIMGMVLPDQGLIEVNNQPVKGHWKYRQLISYLPQIARFPDNLSVQEVINLIRDLRHEPAQPEPLIQRFGLAPHLQKRLRHLSGGTKQKVNLTLAFMYDTPIIVLDEPTAGLDPVAMIRFRELLHEAREKGKIILVTTHIMGLVEEIADEIAFLLEGKIYFRGTLEEILTRCEESSLEKAIAKILLGECDGPTARAVNKGKQTLILN